MMVDIHFMANPDMNERERSLVETEFGMANGILKVNTRAALVMYTLHAYQVDADQEQGAYKQRLVLANREDIAPFLW